MATNSQPVVGIAGIQAAARSSGSTTRAGSKKFFLLAIRWAPLIGLLLALAFLWRDYTNNKTPTTQKGDAPIASTSLQTARNEAKWERLAADGSIPVGTWSEWISTGIDCDHKFFLGQSNKGQWKDVRGEIHDMVKGSSLDHAVAIRFMVTEAGVKNFPMKVTCS